MDKVLRCDCGFEVRATDGAELVDRVQRHAWEAHGMEFTDEQVLLLAFRAGLDLELGGETGDDASQRSNTEGRQ